MPWLRLLGQPALGHDHDTAIALERKDAALLALLALGGGGSRSLLAAWLWPDAAPRTAAGSLRQRIFRLRRRLGHPLVRTGERLALLDDVRCDTAGPLPPNVAPSGLLADEDYADCPAFAEWLTAERARLRQRWCRDSEAAAQAAEARGDLDAALEMATALAQADPLAEAPMRRVVRLLYLRGDAPAAIAAFETYEQRLRDELGTRPGAEAVALLATIQAGRGVAAPAVARRAEVPASLLRPPRLIGRADELQRLARAWANRRGVLVVGEAGMGKTRLLAEFAAAQAGVVHVAARPGDAGVPFALIVRLLRALAERGMAAPDADTRRELSRLLPEWGDAAPGHATPASPPALQRAVLAVLAGASPHIDALMLDDLHFADAASLEMLTALVAADTLAALHFGLAQRPDEGAAELRTLREALEEAQRLEIVHVKPLTRADLVELLASLALTGLQSDAAADELLARTGGNPLYVLETLKEYMVCGPTPEGRLPQPASVGVLIERRLRRLSAGALALARVAALARSDFSIDLAEAVLRTPALTLADAWRELETAQVLAGSSFVHDLVRDAVERSVPDDIARYVHGAIALHLERGGEEPARMATHWWAAGQWARAGEQFERAARRARQAARLADAREFWQRAIEAHTRAGAGSAAFRARLDSMDVLIFTDGVEAAATLAGRLVEEAPDDAARARARVVCAQVAIVAGDAGRALTLAQEALRGAQAVGDSCSALDATRQIGQSTAQIGRAEEAVDWLQRWLPQVEREGTLEQRREHLAALAYALNSADRPAHSAEVLQQVCALAQASGDLAELMTSTSNRATALSALGRADEALRQAQDALRLLDRLGDSTGLQPTVTLMNSGVFAMQVGHYRDAIAALETAAERLRAQGGPMWGDACTNHLAALWLTIGQHHRAAALLAAPAASDVGQMLARREALRARLARELGQPAPASLPAQLETLSATTRARSLFALRMEVARLQEPATALRELRRVREEAEAIEYLGIALHALMREIEALTPLDPDGAATLARLALARAAAGCWPSDAYLPELWLHSAEALAASGARDEAAGVRGHALAWIDERVRTHLDAPLRPAFLNRNRVNAALRAAVTRE
ncbi:MAG: AAA family ATPase [Proteobacteria bacterium]|nr:AAA family ATPase [Pseudomonadota bacterium]